MNDIVRQLDNVIEKYKDKTFFTGELNFVEMAKSCKIAIQDLLQEKAERENPKPLTLEELKKRTGKPVWIKHITSACSIRSDQEWRILKPCDLTFERPFIEFENGGLCAYYYEQGWIAYDHEPKEAD